MTLWESAEIKPCAYCGREVKVYDSFAAWAAGERSDQTNGTNTIDPTFKGYENVCGECRGEDIKFRYRVAMTEMREEKGLPIPKWIWGE